MDHPESSSYVDGTHRQGCLYDVALMVDRIITSPYSVGRNLTEVHDVLDGWHYCHVEAALYLLAHWAREWGIRKGDLERWVLTDQVRDAMTPGRGST